MTSFMQMGNCRRRGVLPGGPQTTSPGRAPEQLVYRIRRDCLRCAAAPFEKMRNQITVPSGMIAPFGITTMRSRT